MEALLHYIWQHRLYTELTPRAGVQDIRVLDPGVHNTLDSGPDFFNAKILIDGILWVGTVEIHHSSREWKQHHHDTDPAYSNVILHVVEVDNQPIYTSTGELLPTCLISYPDSLREQETFLLSSNQGLPCTPLHHKLPSEVIYRWLDHLSQERLLQRAERTHDLYEQTSGNWTEVFYILLCRAFGFGLNGDAMERLARSLPFSIVELHTNRLQDVRTLLIGQANLLTEIEDPVERKMMQEDYSFFAHKYALTPLPPDSFRWGRVRPQSMPLSRLNLLASLLYEQPNLSHRLLEQGSVQDCLKQLKSLSRHVRIGIIINALCPFLVSYGAVHQAYSYIDRAKQFLRELPVEEHRYSRLMREAGVRLRHASDSQASIQLSRLYCERTNCIFCSWGRLLLQTKPKGDKSLPEAMDL